MNILYANQSIVGNTYDLMICLSFVCVGAAAGPLFAGFVSDHLGWEYVFFMLMISDVFALCVSIIISQRWKKEASGGHMCNPRCAKLTLQPINRKAFCSIEWNSEEQIRSSEELVRIDNHRYLFQFGFEHFSQSIQSSKSMGRH